MRLVGITLPDNKKMEIALTAIYGIGRSRSKYLLKKAGINLNMKAKEVSSQAENMLRNEIEKIKVEGELRREIGGNVKRLKDIKCYRGSRHSRGLPVRGQRTKTNSRTRRGNVRKTMGTGRRAVDKK